MEVHELHSDHLKHQQSKDFTFELCLDSWGASWDAFKTLHAGHLLDAIHSLKLRLCTSHVLKKICSTKEYCVHKEWKLERMHQLKCVKEHMQQQKKNIRKCVRKNKWLHKQKYKSRNCVRNGVKRTDKSLNDKHKNQNC